MKRLFTVFGRFLAPYGRSFFDFAGTAAVLIFVLSAISVGYMAAADISDEIGLAIGTSFLTGSIFFVVQHGLSVLTVVNKDRAAYNFLNLMKDVRIYFYLPGFRSDSPLQQTGEGQSVSWRDVKAANSVSLLLKKIAFTAADYQMDNSDEFEPTPTNRFHTCFFIGLHTNTAARELLMKSQETFKLNSMQNKDEDPTVYDISIRSLGGTSYDSHINNGPVSYAMIYREAVPMQNIVNFWIGGNDPHSTMKASEYFVSNLRRIMTDWTGQDRMIWLLTIHNGREVSSRSQAVR